MINYLIEDENMILEKKMINKPENKRFCQVQIEMMNESNMILPPDLNIISQAEATESKSGSEIELGNEKMP